MSQRSRRRTLLAIGALSAACFGYSFAQDVVPPPLLPHPKASGTTPRVSLKLPVEVALRIALPSPKEPQTALPLLKSANETRTAVRHANAEPIEKVPSPPPLSELELNRSQSLPTPAPEAEPLPESLPSVPPEPHPEIIGLPPITDEIPNENILAIPADFVPWWQPEIAKSLRPATTVQPVDLQMVIFQALTHSAHIQALADEPLIRETAIQEAAANFDPKVFLDTKYNSLSDPVGNTLTTGGPSRFREQSYKFNGGLRQKNTQGGTWEFAQKLGTLYNNSIFLVPKQQGNARLSLNYTQPILRGAGQVYNTSLIVLAQLDTDAAIDQTRAELQEQLLEVTRAYWQLHLSRAELLQKQKLAERAQVVLAELEGRRDIDVMQNQLARARSAATTRRVKLVRAASEVRNAETKLRALVQVPEWSQNGYLEFVPTDAPLLAAVPVALEDCVVTALQHRPEVNQALHRLQSANVRLGVANHELMPQLDFILEGYVAGLSPNFNTFGAYSDQFSEGQPGYAGGLLFELPLGNQAAQSRHTRRQLELRQLTAQFRDLLENFKAEVEVAAREVTTTHQEMEGYYHAMEAAQADIHFMQERWEVLPGDDRSRSFLLEDLLSAQERLAEAELQFARSQLLYAVALTNLKRASGTLLETEAVNSKQQATGSR